MVEIDAYYWSTILQPRIAKEMQTHQLIDDYLNSAGHEFTDFRKPDYKFRLFFDNPENEVIFRLKYGIK
jgi:hypothetical protein